MAKCLGRWILDEGRRKLKSSTKLRMKNKFGEMKLNSSSSTPLVLLLSLCLIFGVTLANFCSPEMASTLGGVHESRGSSNSNEVDDLARFAVEEHNKKENALLEFARVIKAQEQVVAGTLHHLTLEVIDAGKKKLYEAKVWVKPWMHFKELQEFKQTGDAPSFTPSDLGAKKGEGHCSGWKSVPAHDPLVQDAANHAVQTIQQRSNSLFPYELKEVVHAKAEVVEDSAKFDMVIKVKRGDKEEKFKVEVHQNNEGTLHLNQMEPDHSP